MAATVLGIHDMPASASAVRTARRWLRGVLAADHAGISDGVVLLASELLGNAIRHSDSAALDENGRPGRVRIVVIQVDDLLRVEVGDAGSSGSVPCLADRGADAETGRGLRIVEDLTGGRWGTYADEVGRVVWFAVPLADGRFRD